MKHKIIKPDKDFKLETQVKKSEHKLAHPNEEIDKANTYSLSYVYMSTQLPIMSLSISIIATVSLARVMVSRPLPLSKMEMINPTSDSDRKGEKQDTERLSQTMRQDFRMVDGSDHASKQKGRKQD